MSSPQITYTPRSDTTPEAEVSALAAVYRLVIDRAMQNAAGVSSTNGDDAKERSKDDSSATQKYTRRP
jgi:hypothetical protein